MDSFCAVWYIQPMLIFCLLWLPACYVFWVSIKSRPFRLSKDALIERLFALLTGAIAGAVRFFFPCFWNAQGFGLSRYIGALCDYIAVPALIPIVLCAAFSAFNTHIRKKRHFVDWTGFVILSLMPMMFVRATRWGTDKNPVNLVVVPLVLSAIAFALSTLARFVRRKPVPSRFIIAVLAAAALLLLGAAVWCAFFSSKNLRGFVLLAAELLTALPCFLLNNKTRNAAGSGISAAADREPEVRRGIKPTPSNK